MKAYADAARNAIAAGFDGVEVRQFLADPCTDPCTDQCTDHGSVHCARQEKVLAPAPLRLWAGHLPQAKIPDLTILS